MLIICFIYYITYYIIFHNSKIVNAFSFHFMNFEKQYIGAADPFEYLFKPGMVIVFHKPKKGTTSCCMNQHSLLSAGYSYNLYYK